MCLQETTLMQLWAAIISLALRSDGSLAAWGYNLQGQCNVPAGNDFVAIAGGGYHSLALKEDGSLAAWGGNWNGQCNVPAGNDFVAIVGGYYHSLALKSDGSFVAWGGYNFGAGNDFVAIAGRGFHILALRSDGSLFAWGDNYWGQCNVPAGNDFVAIAAGRFHSLAQVGPPDPVEQIEELIGKVFSLVDEGKLNKGEANSLNSKLDAALKSIEKGKTNTACNQLGAFINQVNALINSGRLTQEEGEQLIFAAEAVIAELCG